MMLRLTSICALAALGTICRAGGDLSDCATGNPALKQFGAAVVFYVSFDGHANAEITPANPAPRVDTNWTAAVTNPPGLYVPGVFGKGVRSKNYTLTYTWTDAVMSSAGTMALWIKPEQLAHKGTAWWPFLMEGRYIAFAGRMGNPVNKEILYAHLRQGPGNTTSTIYSSMADWKPGVWHLLAMTWDRTGFGVSVDGSPPARTSLAAPLGPPEPGEFRVHLITPNEDAFVCDEFLMLNVPLGAEELHRLYTQGMEAISHPGGSN